MKKIFTITFVLVFAAFSPNHANAQIQLSPDDIYHQGTYQMGLDKSGGFDPGTPGANKVWDFSGLKNQTPFKYTISGYNGKGNGNDANLVRADGPDTFEYMLKSGADISVVMPLQDFDKVFYRKYRAFSLPFNFNDINKDSFTFTAYHSGSDMGMASYDSIMLTFKIVYESKADAWGILKLPMSDFNALRVKTESKTNVRVAGKKGNLPYTNIPAYDQDEDLTEYLWFAKGKGHNIASYDPDNGNVRFQQSAVLSNSKLQKDNDISITNPISNDLKIRNTGSNNFKISMFDISGKLISSGMIEGYSAMAIDTSTLPDGMYLLEMLNIETQTVRIEKLVK